MEVATACVEWSMKIHHTPVLLNLLRIGGKHEQTETKKFVQNGT